MNFANLFNAHQTMKAACLAHAEKNGWDMDFNITEGKYYWTHSAWWPQMVRFILAYEVDEVAINKWGMFDKLDAGLAHIHSVSSIHVRDEKVHILSPSNSDTGEVFKRHAVFYFMRERLRS